MRISWLAFSMRCEKGIDPHVYIIPLGYMPNGNGITYKGQPTVAGQAYPLDDDLILWLTKQL